MNSHKKSKRLRGSQFQGWKSGGGSPQKKTWRICEVVRTLYAFSFSFSDFGFFNP